MVLIIEITLIWEVKERCRDSKAKKQGFLQNDNQ